jgi:hypothetical protein
MTLTVDAAGTSGDEQSLGSGAVQQLGEDRRVLRVVPDLAHPHAALLEIRHSQLMKAPGIVAIASVRAKALPHTRRGAALKRGSCA